VSDSWSRRPLCLLVHMLKGEAMRSVRRRFGQGPRALATGFLAVVLASIWLDTAGVAPAKAEDSPARISQEQATQAALKALPGKVTDVSIEKKRGKKVYVIEIVADKDGAETDVLVDPDSGQVLGMDK
jgi:hypothetical protein